MPPRAIVKHPKYFIAQPFIEFLRLEIKRIQMDQVRPFLPGGLFRLPKQSLSDPIAPAAIGNPQHIHIRAVPAIHPGNDPCNHLS